MFFLKKKDKEKCILTLKRYKYVFTVKDGGSYESETNWIVANNIKDPSSFVIDCFIQKGYIIADLYYPMHNVTRIETRLLDEKTICVSKENSSYWILTDKQVEEFTIDE